MGDLHFILKNRVPFRLSSFIIVGKYSFQGDVLLNFKEKIPCQFNVCVLSMPFHMNLLNALTLIFIRLMCPLEIVSPITCLSQNLIGKFGNESVNREIGCSIRCMCWHVMTRS